MTLLESRKRKNLILFFFALSLSPFIYLFFDESSLSNFWLRVANLFGFIGAVLIIWQFILGVRGFSKWLTHDYDWVIKIHTFLGINSVLFIVLHPMMEFMVYQRELNYLFELNFSNTYEAYLSYGKIGFYLFLLVWLSSSILRKAIKYRVWLYIHYFSYLMLFFILLHPLKIGSILQSNILVYSYWILICILAFLIILLKILDVFNITNKRFTLIEIKNYPGDTFTLKYKPLDGKFTNIKPGQYFYIKTPFISEAHPFSILEFNEDTGELTFGVKKLGKYSAGLSNSQVSDIHYLDGPFGEFTFEGHNSDPKVILAGGIGITPFYELVSRFGDSNTYLFYANKNIDSALYRSKFKELLGKNYFDFVIEKEGPKENVFCEIISSRKIKELLNNYNLNEFKFFICGSPGFTKAMIECLKEVGVTRKNIYIEEFEY